MCLPPFTLNPKMKIPLNPLVLAKPYQVLGMALEMPQLVHFVARVVSCFSHPEIVSLELVT